MKKARGMEIYKLEYRQKCDKLLDKIFQKAAPFGQRGDVGTNMRIVKQIQFLYTGIFPEYNKRAKRLSMLMTGKYAMGDDLLLRIAYSFLSNIRNVQKEINAGFKDEIREYTQKMNDRNNKQKPTL